jgi:hypothetical protein
LKGELPTDIGSIRLSDSERKDHIARLLEIASGDVGGREVTAGDREASAQHGDIRYKQGYSLPLLIRETRLLQDAIAVCIHRNLLGIEISTLIPDMVRLFAPIHVLLEESVSSFIQQGDSERPLGRARKGSANNRRMPS